MAIFWGCTFTMVYINEKKIAKIRLRIFEEDSNIENIRIVEDDWPLPITINHLTITYFDGRRLELSNINESLEDLNSEAPMSIFRIGDYSPLVCDLDENNLLSEFPQFLLIKTLGEKLDRNFHNVNDVIKDYERIYNYVSNLLPIPENLPVTEEENIKFFVESRPEISENVSSKKYIIFKSYWPETEMSTYEGVSH
jgi:hypothetical protein